VPIIFPRRWQLSCPNRHGRCRLQNDNAISTPIDNDEPIRTVAVSTLPSYSVTQASQSAGSYADTLTTSVLQRAQVSAGCDNRAGSGTPRTSAIRAQPKPHKTPQLFQLPLTTAFNIPLTWLECLRPANPGDATVNGRAFGARTRGTTTRRTPEHPLLHN